MNLNQLELLAYIIGVVVAIITLAVLASRRATLQDDDWDD